MHSMTGQVEDRSKNTKRKQMALLMLKHRNILHNKRNTIITTHNRNSYQAILDFSDNFMKLIAVVKFQRHSIIFLQKAKVFLPTSDASRLTLQHLIILL